MVYTCIGQNEQKFFYCVYPFEINPNFIKSNYSQDSQERAKTLNAIISK